MRTKEHLSTYENDDGELPHPPPPSPFYDGVHPTLAQFMAKSSRQFAERVSPIPQPVGLVKHEGCSMRETLLINNSKFSRDRMIHDRLGLDYTHPTVTTKKINK
jgi:hypothetical protein